VCATSGRVRQRTDRRVLPIGPSAVVARLKGRTARRLALSAMLAWLAGTAVVSAETLGDFGRVDPGVVNDTIFPAIDTVGKFLTGQPQSRLLRTDEEGEMHDRVWRFLVAPYAKDWAFEYGWEIKPASLDDRRPKRIGRYYKWLHNSGYASSHARFNAVTEHAAWDIGTLPGVFHAICVVEEIDRQRAVAADGLPDIEPRYLREVNVRYSENQAYIGRFVLALAYRYQSYGYALDHLLVETPHREAVDTDAALSELAVWVDRAEARDFCGHGWGHDADGDGAIRPRVLMNAPSEGEYLK
jgi:hypothetical protein